jgi:hypothetical membrane protein
MENQEIIKKININMIVLLCSFALLYIIPYLGILLTNYIVLIVVGCLQIGIILYDHRILNNAGIPICSKWWFLLPPVYIWKRSNALGISKKHFFIWLGIWILGTIATFMIVPKSYLEEAACTVVTDIIRNQFKNGERCINVSIAESQKNIHYGEAILSNHKVVNVQITEMNNGQIFVEVY